MNTPFISIICPVFNEEKYIEDCIRSIIAQNYPKEQLELFFVDGGSSDRTQEIIANYCASFSFIKLLQNPHKTPPYAMNIGIKQAKGEYIIRLDGHSSYPNDYFSKLIQYAIDLQADNVGGICLTDTKRHNAKSKAIKEVLSNRMGVGNSEFRIEQSSNIREVDTVPFGCFRRDVFKRFGLYDERLTRNQDIELNKRIKVGGGKIYLVPDIKCTYYARDTFSALARNNFANGKWNILTVFYTHTIRSLSLRHFIPLMFVLSLVMPALTALLWWPLIGISLFSLLLYFAMIILASIRVCLYKKVNFLCLLWGFLCLHVSYGVGSLFGLLHFMVKSDNLALSYQKKIATVVNRTPEDVFLFRKGRVALYTLLKTMQVGEGDEVILPAFTCVVVANAIKYLKATPVYADIREDSYTLDLDKVRKCITSKTKVLIVQNSFGLSANLVEFQLLAKQYGLFMIEDCTHGFGGTYQGMPNGQWGDAAFFSTQWNKPFSTGIGGFAVLNNPALRTAMTVVQQSLRPPSFRDSLELPLLYFIRERLLVPRIYWSMLKCYRWLSRINLVTGSSSGVELEGTVMPHDYLTAVSSTQIRKGVKAIDHISTTVQARKVAAAKYSAFLQAQNKTPVSPQFFEDHLFLYYPIKVTDKEKVLQMAEQYRILVSDWFNSPLHPVKDHLEQWDLLPEQFPVAMRTAHTIVNLPTLPQNIEKVLDFLVKIKPYLL